MRLEHLSVQCFQCIESAELDFGPGLNVLYGPNDLGKSSLAWAIRAVLLLQHSSSVHERFVSWYGEGDPRVALTFADDDDRLWRVTKTFGGGSTGRSLLETSRDGRTFTTDASGRQVDDKLRTMLGWGVQKPGGQGPRGLPESFLTQVLLAEQDNVRKVLFDASLANDPDEAGRLRLVEALGALAQDPLFKRILDETQGYVDKAFTPTGRKKRTAGSPLLKHTTQLNDQQAQHDELSLRVRETEAAEAKIRELIAGRDRLEIEHAAATDALQAAQRALAARAHRDELERQLATQQGVVTGVEALQQSLATLERERATRRAAMVSSTAAVRAAEAEAAAAETARGQARSTLDALAHDDADHEARTRDLGAARDEAQRRLDAAVRGLDGATEALALAEICAADVGTAAAATRTHAERAQTAEEKMTTAKRELELAQQVHAQAKERARDAASDTRAQARELARRELENQRLQCLAARTTAATQGQVAVDVGDQVSRAAKARATVTTQLAQLARDADAVTAHAARLAEVDTDATALRHLELFAAYRHASLAADEVAKDDAAVALARAQAAKRRADEAALRATLRSELPTAAAIAALRELYTERRTAEARLGGGITVTVRPKQPITITGEADGVAVAARKGVASTVIAAAKVLRLELGEIADLEITAGEESARQAATALEARWREEGAPVLAAHGAETLEALEALRREADDVVRDAERLHREAIGFEERARPQRTPAEAAAIVARRDELAADLADLDRAALGEQLTRLGDRWQATLTLQREQLGARRDAAVAGLESARARAARAQDDLQRLTATADDLEREAARRQRELSEPWSVVVAACEQRLVDLGRTLAELDQAVARLGEGGDDDDRRVAETALVEATTTLATRSDRHEASLTAWQRARELVVAATTKLEGARTRARTLPFASDWAGALDSVAPALPLDRWRTAVADATVSRDAAETARQRAAASVAELQATRAAVIATARAAVATAEDAARIARDHRATRQAELTTATEHSRVADTAVKDVELQLAQTNVDGATRAIEELRQQLAALPALDRSIDPADVAQQESAVTRVAAHLAEATDEVARARGGLEHVGGTIVREQLRDLDQAMQQTREQARQVELAFDAWKLLLETLRTSESTEGAHLGRALAGPVSTRFRQLTSGRYGNLELGAHLDDPGLHVAGERREIHALSAGTQDQLATLLRLCVAEQLRSTIVLDDHLSQSDPTRVAWFNAILRSAAQQVQVILITCRPAELLGRDEFPRPGETAFSAAAGLLRAVDLTGIIRRFA